MGNLKPVVIILLLACASEQQNSTAKYEECQGCPPAKMCEECTYIVREVIGEIAETLEKDEPIPFTGDDPCTDCKFSGGSTMQQIGSACVMKHPNLPNCLMEWFMIKFDFVNIVCNCSLSSDIRTLLTLGQVERLLCNLDMPSSFDTNGAGNEFVMRNMKDIAACTIAAAGAAMETAEDSSQAKVRRFAAGVPPSTSQLTGPSQPTSSGTIAAITKPVLAGAKWPNVVAGIMITKCPNLPPKMTSLKMLSPNYDNITTHCRTDYSQVNPACACLQSSDFLKSMLVRSTKSVIPCLLNKNEERLTSIVGDLYCGDKTT